mmetsp:Transcript_29358/g.32624  ORF Transcript_29358/g.32624 Transcript_29358/m.32624 type:complete len:93 (-) Transcript_29358:297-575(-)
MRRGPTTKVKDQRSFQKINNIIIVKNKKSRDDEKNDKDSSFWLYYKDKDQDSAKEKFFMQSLRSDWRPFFSSKPKNGRNMSREITKKLLLAN